MYRFVFRVFVDDRTSRVGERPSVAHGIPKCWQITKYLGGLIGNFSKTIAKSFKLGFDGLNLALVVTKPRWQIAIHRITLDIGGRLRGSDNVASRVCRREGAEVIEPLNTLARGA